MPLMDALLAASLGTVIVALPLVTAAAAVVAPRIMVGVGLVTAVEPLMPADSESILVLRVYVSGPLALEVIV